MTTVSSLISSNISQTLANQAIWKDILYNVKAEPFSAVGDGVVDDTIAVQACIDAAMEEGRMAIFFPHGTYYVTALDHDDSVTFFGDNASFTGGYGGSIAQLGFADIKPSSSGSFPGGVLIRIAEIDTESITDDSANIYGLFRLSQRQNNNSVMNSVLFTVSKIAGEEPKMFILSFDRVASIGAFSEIRAFYKLNPGAGVKLYIIASFVSAAAGTFEISLLDGNPSWVLPTPAVMAIPSGYSSKNSYFNLYAVSNPEVNQIFDIGSKNIKTTGAIEANDLSSMDVYAYLSLNFGLNTNGAVDYSKISSGAGSPEGVVTGSIGDIYVRNNGSTSTTLYIKTANTGNTGWTAK